MKGLLKQIVITVIAALVPIVKEAIEDLLEDWKYKKDVKDIKEIGND